jgi:hypothetical protein
VAEFFDNIASKKLSKAKVKCLIEIGIFPNKHLYPALFFLKKRKRFWNSVTKFSQRGVCISYPNARKKGSRMLFWFASF